ncbi:hypothetical protein [Sphingopyxis macrogoltabida]|uniref:Uncharacterized protein n=1 Tax=Sphingopyxis macrogoltabida TaxID=33050 RepID=A0AAC8Z141_SPHMC|nr:hypothetical protein [Sphingopyxis macrogoltabida]ALJ12641.1 hypothetical protein LH19_07155 [Sphingopyxis macrogoltabida]AMU89891.1 hypothetical protein ATM17_12680 [Sphingopyxis macrogoltabida]
MILAILLVGAVPASGTCDKLAEEYEGASKKLAMSMADGLGDTSAIRKTMRETQDANVLAEAQQTLNLMVAHKCSLPTTTPKGGLYLIPAIECRTARLKQDMGEISSSDEACDMSKWVKTQGD